MSQKPETELIRNIRDYLHLLGAVTTRVNSGLKVMEEPGGKNRRVLRMAEAGTSDIVGCFKGRYIAIEAKIAPNKTTLAQEEFLQKVRDAGGIAFVAYSLDDVDRELDIATYR